MTTIASAEGVARPNVVTAVNGMRSLLPAASQEALSSRSEGRATSWSGAARLWVVMPGFEAMVRCSTAPRHAPGRTTGRAGRARPAQAPA